MGVVVCLLMSSDWCSCSMVQVKWDQSKMKNVSREQSLSYWYVNMDKGIVIVTKSSCPHYKQFNV